MILTVSDVKRLWKLKFLKMEKVLDLETLHEDIFEKDRKDENDKYRERKKDMAEEKEDFNIEFASDTKEEEKCNRYRLRRKTRERTNKCFYFLNY